MHSPGPCHPSASKRAKKIVGKPTIFFGRASPGWGGVGWSGDCRARGMHCVTFMLKRAHLQNVTFGRRVLKKVRGMTPARFDLLYLLRRVALSEGPSFHPLAATRLQSGLRKDLGLHRSTVSKMLKRLEEMGWIRRERNTIDRRTFSVRLTELGLRRIWRAMRRVFRRKVMIRAYEGL